MIKKTLIAASITAVLMSGCATTPDTDDRAERLRDNYQQVVTINQAERYAPVKLKVAEEELLQLEQMIAQDAEEDAIRHQIYLTQKAIDIAEQTARMKQADEFVSEADKRRSNLLLTARTREAEQARAEAAAMGQRAESSAEQARRAEERARLANERAAEAEAFAARMAEKAEELEGEVQNLTTQQTDRGLVLTLGNILFEFDKATIKSGADRTLERVAEFLNEYAERKVRVEGFTDDVGSDGYNQDLSERRARAIKTRLGELGVAEGRISTRGYGEEHPVASNDSEAGRLQNRRVEIVIAEEGEEVMERE